MNYRDRNHKKHKRHKKWIRFLCALVLFVVPAVAYSAATSASRDFSVTTCCRLFP